VIDAYTQPPFTHDVLDFLAANALAIAIHQRGDAVLHASCVRGPRADVAFIGPSGSGKSTMAAAMVRRNHALLADDFIAFTLTSPVQPGVPQLRLWPDSARALQLEPDAAIRNGESPKATWDAGALPPHTAQSRSERLLLLLFLHEDDSIAIRRMSRPDALFSLLNNAYCAPVLDRTGLAQEFDVWSDVARAIDCYEFRRPRRFDRMDEVIDAVEAFVEQA
jgi:hypothetical protein